MPPGNQAVFSGTINGDGNVDWSTNFVSMSREGVIPPKTCSIPVTANEGSSAVAAALANQFNLDNPGFSAAASGSTVTFSASNYAVTGMTVDGLTVSPTGTSIGSTGMIVAEPETV